MPSTSTAPAPGLPLVAPAETQYTLYYRSGMNPHPQFTFFRFASEDIQRVVERAKQFCNTTNKRFVSVTPSFTDFTRAEKSYLTEDQA